MPRPAPALAHVPLPAPEPTPEELCADGAMSLKDAAAFVGFCERELRRLIYEGKLVSFLHNTKRLIPKRALVALLAGDLRASREGVEANQGNTGEGR